MALVQNRPRVQVTRFAFGIFVIFFLGGCASNRAVHPCMNAISSSCDQIGNEQEELPTATPFLSSPEEMDNLVSPQPTSSGTPMSLAQIAAHTITHNPGIGITRAQANNAKANINVVHVAYAPKIDFSAAAGHEETYNYESEIHTTQTRSEATIRASQLLFDFGKTQADGNWAIAVHESTVWRQQAKTDAVLLEMIEAYLSVLELTQQINNSQINERAHQQMHRIIKLNADAGNATHADVQRITVSLESAHTLSINLRSERQNAASNFKRLTGLEPTVLQMPATIAPETAKLAIADIEGYAARDPKMLSLEWDIVGLEAQQVSLQRDYLPEISLNASAHIQQNVMGENPVNTSGRIMLSISGQLYDGGERQAKNEQLIARIEEVQYRYRQTLDQLVQDIEDSARILRTANEKRNSITQRITASQNVVTLYQQQFEAGSRTIFELLDVQKELFAAKSEQISTRFEVLRATYQAVRLNGSLADTVLKQS